MPLRPPDPPADGSAGGSRRVRDATFTEDEQEIGGDESDLFGIREGVFLDEDRAAGGWVADELAAEGADLGRLVAGRTDRRRPVHSRLVHPRAGREMDDGEDEGGRGPDRGPSAGRPAPGVPRGDLVGVIRRRLPATLHGIVVAPAARAALVLALVALAAALMTAWFSWQHRPVPLASSEVDTPRTGESAAAGNARSDHSDHGATSATDTSVTSAPTARAARTGASGEVVVDVAGRVARPGVVRLPAGARVVDAIERAGGVLPGTDTTGLALARLLVDGEQVLVDGKPGPARPGTAAGQPAGTGLGSAGSTAATGPIDLNAATAEELDGLPGVGPVLARRIVEWRTAHGPFRSPEQLAEVTGVGDKRLADLLPLLKV